MKTNGTCVLAQLTNLTAFASVEQDGQVWVKTYPSLNDAIREAKGNGLVDKLFAAAAAQYITQGRQHCVSPIAGPVDHEKLVALGFTKPRTELLA